MKVQYYIYSLIAAVMIMFTACSPDDYSMGAKELSSADLQEGIAFTVAADGTNPNLIHLKSLLNGYTVVWNHPGVGLGHSTGSDVDLQIAFPGTYYVQYGVETSGGVVYSDSVKVSVANFCADFVSSEKWTLLSGGPGKSKTWVPDNGNYGMKQGFYSCFEPSATAADMTHDEGMNNWYAKGKTWWEPSNSDVGITADDLKQIMKFSLENGANITVTDASGKATTGSFAFDETTTALNAEGVEFAHGAWANGKSLSFSKNFIVLYVSENQLMIANHRDPGLSGEGDCLYCWNFVSKEYADSYKPTEVTEPKLPDTWNNDINKQTNTTIDWVLNANSPFDWFTLAGKEKNAYTKAGDYPAFASLASGIDNIKLRLDSSKGTYTLFKAGAEVVSGTYTLSDKGVYTFSNGLGKTLLGGDYINLAADADNQLRILSYDVKTTTGKADNLWLGAKEKDNDGNLYQYLGYHFNAITYGDVVLYDCQLNFFDTGWAFTKSDVVSTNKAGQYTLTVNGSSSSPYGIYLDVTNILAEHPKATLTLNDVAVDGKSVKDKFDINYSGFTQKEGAQLTGDLATTARIYLLNPWDTTSPFASDNSVFKFSSSIAVTFTIAFND